jgi:shikimate dehydrogenase
MPRAAVLGKPIAHSLSPVLHAAAYQALGLSDWAYTAIECDAAALPKLLADADDSWLGFSCTMPVKEAALSAAAVASAAAAAVGAANTLTRMPDGRWRADNTDIAGIVASVSEQLVSRQRVSDQPGAKRGPSQYAGSPGGMLVLGAGGTARAALAAAAQWGIDRVDLVVRDRARAEAARAAGERLGIATQVRVFSDPDIGDVVAQAPLVISTLPQGAADEFAQWPWRREQVVLDVVYVPWPTRLAAAAAQGGATIVTGAAMLLHQAAAQVAAMTGLEPPVEAMRAALRAVVPPGVL